MRDLFTIFVDLLFFFSFGCGGDRDYELNNIRDDNTFSGNVIMHRLQ